MAAGMGQIWQVQLHEVYQLGASGKYNINSTTDWGIFGTTGGSFNNYTPTTANVVNANGVVTTAGETQIYGFDLSVNDSLVMPVRKEFSAIDDPTLLRYQKQGFLIKGPYHGNMIMQTWLYAGNSRETKTARFSTNGQSAGKFNYLSNKLNPPTTTRRVPLESKGNDIVWTAWKHAEGMPKSFPA